MTVYTVDYVNHKIRQERYDNVADLQAFTREMDYLYGEWFDNLADAQAELDEYDRLTTLNLTMTTWLT